MSFCRAFRLFQDDQRASGPSFCTSFHWAATPSHRTVAGPPTASTLGSGSRPRTTSSGRRSNCSVRRSTSRTLASPGSIHDASHTTPPYRTDSHSRAQGRPWLVTRPSCPRVPRRARRNSNSRRRRRVEISGYPSLSIIRRAQGPPGAQGAQARSVLGTLRDVEFWRPKLADCSFRGYVPGDMKGKPVRIARMARPAEAGGAPLANQERKTPWTSAYRRGLRWP